MVAFATGQRWTSIPEPELGLGMVVSAENRRVRIFFPDSGEDRTYSMNDAPLSRVIFDEGDEVVTGEGDKVRVISVIAEGDLVVYKIKAGDEEQLVAETQIVSGSTQFPSMERLLNGRWDRASWFRMRRDLSMMLPEVEKSEVRGLVGPRVTPVPHQLHIANELAKRHAPRVLLADEVGLGKTIEAGLIIHQQLTIGAASRVLILLPDSLVHQWLVEMRRRFNLKFNIIDDDAFSDNHINPFEQAQCFICPLSLLCGDLEHLQRALNVDWDLLVVDEAHHIEWSRQESSWEYSCLEQLTQEAKGLLLLTATPEQTGEESHFGRLRLLDPARYDDFEQWRAEESKFQQINDILVALESGLDPELSELNELLTDDELQAAEEKSPQERLTWLYDVLLDRHGTGRVMFRNTRKVIADLLPGRHLETYPLDGSSVYGSVLLERSGLMPEQGLDETWVESDPRVTWLLEFLKSDRARKVLVIAHNRSTVEHLESFLTLRHGVRVAGFHEGLSMVNRDRAAAWFADEEDGAQVLICSEIGSEGRNFQFASDLVMFDLPEHPDLLEQRIGRLDRIGQKNRVAVHVPYFTGSVQETLLQIYDSAMACFVSASMANGIVYSEQSALIESMLDDPLDDHSESIDYLKSSLEEVRERLAQGRDCLLERSSHQPEKAEAVVEQVNEYDDDPALELWLINAFDRFGIESELISERIYFIRPTGHRMVEQLASLSAEGLSATFDREVALAREDVEWLSWEHPLVSDFMELLTLGEYGTAQAAVMKSEEVPAGTILLECYFKPQWVAPKALQIQRFAPLEPLRVVLKNGEVWADPISTEAIDEARIKIERKPVSAVVDKLSDKLKRMIKVAAEFAAADINAECVDAAFDAEDFFDEEIERLQSLMARNPSIRADELTALESQKAGVTEALRGIEVRLDSVRFVLNT